MSGWYKGYKRRCMDGTAPDLLTATIAVLGVDVADYAVDLAAHDFLDDVAAGARVTGLVTLGSKTIDVPEGGVFDAADAVATAVSGDPFESLIVLHDTGVEATSLLIAYLDGFTATPNGGDITFRFAGDPNRIGKL